MANQITCPRCAKGKIRVEHVGASMARFSFCDNQDCFSWFNVPNAQERGDGTVLAPDGIRYDERVSRAMQARLTVDADEWSAYISAHPLVVQEKP